MKTITSVLTEVVSAAFAKCGYDASLGVVMPSDRLDLCQFQCNGAFAGAKLHRKAPAMIAKDVAAVLGENPIFGKVEVANPGFLNLTLTDDALLDYAVSVCADPHCGIEQVGEGKTVVLDYGGPNVAKPLHIGHLRSAIIGESLKRLALACGYKAIGDIHLGDWGLQIGLVIAELNERHPEWRCFADDYNEEEGVPPLDTDTLNEVYPFASGKSKTDEVFREKAHKATADLQNGRVGYIALWKEIMRVSVGDLKKNYDDLNVSFDLWLGESDAGRSGDIDKLMQILEDKDLLRESEGALVVDVAEETDNAPMPPVIVQKSDKSSLYATSDLATLMQRVRDYDPAEIWYIVDNRQGLHFTQIFRCAKKAGIASEKNDLSFLGFGTMNGTDGKPYKTRDGGVMRLRDMLDIVTNDALERLRSSAYLASVSEEEKLAVARKVGVAAIKFGDLINHRSKDYIFDMDKFLSFEGKTGTYILYTVTRINSILKKADCKAEQMHGIYGEAERDLLLKFVMTGNVFAKAVAEKAPNYICENVYQIAAAFSRFYHDCHVLDEQDARKKESWLVLAAVTRVMIQKHLDVLGIESVENM